MREPRPDVDLSMRMNWSAIYTACVITCLETHPVKRRPPSRVREAARTVLQCGSPGELTAVLFWLARAPLRLPPRVGASAWALGETGEPFEYLLRHLDRFTNLLQARRLHTRVG